MNKKTRPGGFLRAIVDAFPAVVLAVDDDVRILEYNQAAAGLVGKERDVVLKRRGGEVLNCLHAHDTADGCGRGPSCGECVIRGSVNQAFLGSGVVRRRTRLVLEKGDRVATLFALITASPFEYQGRKSALLVIEDISEMMELRDIVPICMKCRKVRNDEQYWVRVEEYFKKHLDLDFSHGFCPECGKEELARLQEERKNRG